MLNTRQNLVFQGELKAKTAKDVLRAYISLRGFEEDMARYYYYWIDPGV